MKTRSWLRSTVGAGASFGLAAALLVPTSSAQAADVGANHVRYYGSSGHAELYAWGLAATDNSVLIADYWNWRVAEYANNGNFVRDVVNDRGYGEEQTQSPYGIAWDPASDSLYVADTDRRRVVKYDSNGNFVFKTGQNNKSGVGPNIFRYPSRVAVASTGQFAVIDTWDQRVSIHNGSTGAEQYDFGGFGTGLGKFKAPHGADFDAQDRLFVADANNHRVQVLELDGTPLYAFGSQGGSPGQFVGDMRGLCIDEDNEWVYVVDAAGNRVNKFDLDGTFITRWGSQGSGNGQFSDGGRECAVDSQHNVVVGDMPNFRAQKFSPTGQHLANIPSTPAPPPEGGLAGPRGVAVDNTGAVIVTDTYNWRLQKFQQNGNVAWAFGSRGRGDYKFNYSRMVDTDPRNNDIVVADTDNNDIKKYDPSGQIVWSVGEQGGGDGQFRNPHGVSIRADGQIAVADTNNDRVVILDEDGDVIRSFGSTGNGNGQFGFPRSIAWGPDNTIWVSDSGRDDLQQFSETGTFIQSIGKGQLANPFDLDVTEDYVVVADTGAHSVVVFDTGGALIGSFGGYGKQQGKMIRPQGLDIRGTDVYVAENDGERIQQFSLEILGAEPPPVDEVDPNLGVDTPSGGQTFEGEPVVVEGSATDNLGVDTVYVGIKDRDTNKWLQSDGSWGGWNTRQLPATLTSPGGTSTDFSFEFAPGVDGDFAAQVEAVDAAGNSSGRIWRNFTIRPESNDSVAPEASIDAPTNNQVYSGTSADFGGSATDNVGVSTVMIAVQDRETKLWWQSDGTWGAFGTRQQEAALASPDGTSTDWSYTFDPGRTGLFGAQVEAFDAAENTSGRQWRRFEIQ